MATREPEKPGGKVPLSPTREVLKVEGKLSYCAEDHACSKLRLKKEVIRKFPHLKKKDENFVYMMHVCDDYSQLKTEINRLEKSAGGVPIIFFVAKEQAL